MPKYRREKMGKKYMDTKKGSLESSVLDVWQDAVNNEDSTDAISRMDGRTKSYREHRAKLEAARVKREAKKLDAVNPNAVKKKFDDRKDKDIDNDGDVDSSDKYLHKRRKAVSKAVKNEEVELDEKLISARGKDVAKKMMKSKTMKPFAKEVAKMQTVTPDDLEKMLPDYALAKLWKDIHSMFEEADLDEGKMSQIDQMMKDGKSAKEIAKALKMDVKAVKKVMGEAYELGTDEYREYLEDLTPGEESDWTKAQNSKVDSMKEAIAKIWGLDEWKNQKENRRVDGGDKRRIENKNGGKTLTGKKAAAVEVEPELKEKKK